LARVGVDDVADFGFVEVAWVGGAWEGERFARSLVLGAEVVVALDRSG